MCLTRLGCFFNGCCFGRPTSLAWGLIFPPDSPAGHYQRMFMSNPVPIHPTQFYCAFSGLVIGATLLLLDRKVRQIDGATAFVAITVYGATRLIVEFYRYYNDHVHLLLGLNHNQWVSVLFLTSGALGIALVSARGMLAGVQPADGPSTANRGIDLPSGVGPASPQQGTTRSGGSCLRSQHLARRDPDVHSIPIRKEN